VDDKSPEITSTNVLESLTFPHFNDKKAVLSQGEPRDAFWDQTATRDCMIPL